MKDPNLLLSVLSMVWVITVGLFIYIIKMKDKNENDNKEALEEIKILISSSNLTTATLKQDLTNNIYFTRDLNSKLGEHIKLINGLETKVATLLEYKLGTERRLVLLERNPTNN